MLPRVRVHLRLHEVVVHRGPFQLGPLSVEVAPGEKVSVLGRSGSGKSTLLKILAGLLRPDSGQLLWDGLDPWAAGTRALRDRQAAFGMVFQKDALFDSETVAQNVLLPLHNRGVPAEEARALTQEILKTVNLLHAADQRPEVLSGGMKKRVGIARAVVARPDVLLADDPFAGLDPHTATAVARVLEDAATGRTLIVALPDPVPFLELPRVIRLASGQRAA